MFKEVKQMNKDFSEGLNYEIYAQLSEKLKRLDPGTEEYWEAFNCLEKLGKLIVENEEKSEALEMENRKLSWDKNKTCLDLGKTICILGTYVACGLTVVKMNITDIGRLQGSDGIKILDYMRNLWKH